MDSDRSAMHTRPSLLVRVRDGADGEAWKVFSKTYRPLVYQFVRKRGLQAADADDLTQEVMEQVARSIRTFQYDPERGRFRDWLYRITRRQLSRFFKGRASRAGEVGPAERWDVEDVDPDTTWNEQFNARVLEVALENTRLHFEPATWRAFEMTWIENRPPAEAAADLAMQVHTVYKAKSRVLKRLQGEVHNMVDDLTWLDELTAR
jgi:RNA polymerase sigma-70 factor (ECF subfamily)